MVINSEDFAPAQDSEERQLFETVRLGVEAKQFMESKLALYICETAESKANEAMRQLKKVNPADTEEITRLQVEIAKFDHFVESMEFMIRAGDAAYQAYRNQFETE